MGVPESPQSDDSSSVPGLVSDYRAQLDVIRSQARDLVRMRADVLDAAERESHAIVTGARSEIRDILVRARRELLVLAAQVQAVTESETLPQLSDGSSTEERSDIELSQERLRAAATSGARQEVRDVLTEARPDLDALSVEAKILRANLLALHSPEDPPRWADPAPPDIELTQTIAAEPVAAEPDAPVSASLDDPQHPQADLDELPRTFSAEPAEPAEPTRPLELIEPDEPTAAASESPVDRLRPDDEAADEPVFRPAPATPSAGRVFVGAFAALAVIAVLGTLWWLRGQNQTSSETSATEPALQTETVPPSGDAQSDANPTAATPGTSAAAAVPTLTIEARRASWIRAQVDGQSDVGRIFGAGETRTITGASRVSIRAGDAGAVYVTVNGAEPEVLGPAGQPLTRDFILGDTQPSAPEAPAADDPKPATEESPSALPAPRAAAPPAPAAPVATPPAQASAPASSTSTATTTLPLPSTPASAPPAAPAPAPAPAVARTTPPAAVAVPPVARLNAPAPTAPTTSASAAPAPPASTSGTPQEDELVALSQRWLDAYLTGNSNTMLAVSGGTPDIRDQRPASERLAPGSGIAAKRSFEAPKLQRGADIGVFSVRMTERAQGASDTSQEHVALVSQVWMRRTGKWQLIDVRIVSESQLKP